MSALPLNNPTLFNAAFDGAYAALLGFVNPTDPARAAASGLYPGGLAPQDAVTTTYANAATIALNFAIEVDLGIGAVTNLSSGNATEPQASTAAIAATQLALVPLMLSLCFAYWQQRGGAAFVVNPAVPATYVAAAAQIKAQFAEAQATFALSTVGSLV